MFLSLGFGFGSALGTSRESTYESIPSRNFAKHSTVALINILGSRNLLQDGERVKGRFLKRWARKPHFRNGHPQRIIVLRCCLSLHVLLPGTRGNVTICGDQCRKFEVVESTCLCLYPMRHAPLIIGPESQAQTLNSNLHFSSLKPQALIPKTQTLSPKTPRRKP